MNEETRLISLALSKLQRATIKEIKIKCRLRFKRKKSDDDYKLPTIYNSSDDVKDSSQENVILLCY